MNRKFVTTAFSAVKQTNQVGEAFWTIYHDGTPFPYVLYTTRAVYNDLQHYGDQLVVQGWAHFYKKDIGNDTIVVYYREVDGASKCAFAKVISASPLDSGDEVLYEDGVPVAVVTSPDESDAWLDRRSRQLESDGWEPFISRRQSGIVAKYFMKVADR